MIYSVAFGVSLAVAVTLALRHGSPGLRRTAIALAANYVAVLVAQAVTYSYAPWVIFIIADTLAALVVLQHPASRVQAAIGGIYVLQIITHVAFGAGGPYHDTRLYLDLLAFGGGCQLLILATGAFHDRGRKVAGARHRRRVAANASSAGLASVEVRK